MSSSVLLIDESKVRKYCQISETLDTEQLEIHIRNAQNLDVKDGLGNAFWTDLLTNRTESAYRALLEGGSYTYQSKTLSFEGLEAALACFTASRYIQSRNIQDTAFGAVQKTNDYGQPVENKSLEKLANVYRQNGLQYFQEVVEFLRRSKLEDSSAYPLFETECRETSGKPAAPFKLSKIG